VHFYTHNVFWSTRFFEGYRTFFLNRSSSNLRLQPMRDYAPNGSKLFPLHYTAVIGTTRRLACSNLQTHNGRFSGKHFSWFLPWPCCGDMKQVPPFPIAWPFPLNSRDAFLVRTEPMSDLSAFESPCHDRPPPLYGFCCLWSFGGSATRGFPGEGPAGAHPAVCALDSSFFKFFFPSDLRSCFRRFVLDWSFLVDRSNRLPPRRPSD